MLPVFVVADSIVSPLGISIAENFEQVKNGVSAIQEITNKALSPNSFFAAMFTTIPYTPNYTRFETICIESLEKALANTDIKLSNSDTIFILSTTKGNIELIEANEMSVTLSKNVSLSNSATKIAGNFNAVNRPVVVSNACVSGVVAVILAKRLLESGKYKHAVIVGADVLSKFVISGFQALQAMSMQPCKPFDAKRSGINLGECAATIILSTDSTKVNAKQKIKVLGGAASNDANHISGPSRTGLELSHAIKNALQDSAVTATDLAFISAHGTATIYNDEMEAKAFNNALLSQVPLHSLKANFGHTLGAAGVLESILSYHSLIKGVVLPSKNYDVLGVSESVNVNRSIKNTSKFVALKTASGFGGCNAAIVYRLEQN